MPERLREARERMYLAQSKLSQLAGLGRMTVGDIEERRNQGNVGILTVEKIAKVLRVSPAWLAYGAGTPETTVAVEPGRPMPSNTVTGTT